MWVYWYWNASNPTLIKLLLMLILSLIFTCLGFLSPASRGTLITVMLLLFVFMGVFAGYYSSRFYKMFQVDSTLN